MQTKVKIYNIENYPLDIKPGVKKREWMDETPNGFAYRCLPLSMANMTGWDIYPREDFIISWDGQYNQSGLVIHHPDTQPEYVTSTFGSGIFTVHTGMLFKTEKEWDMLVTGSPNHPVSFASPLTGVVETWWNDFTFTMNWKLHTAGTYIWPKGRPLCRVLPIPAEYDIVTEVIDLKDDAEKQAAYQQWADDRTRIVEEIDQVYSTGVDGKTVKAGKPKTEWEKNYYTGKRKNGEMISGHKIKRTFPQFTKDA